MKKRAILDFGFEILTAIRSVSSGYATHKLIYLPLLKGRLKNPSTASDIEYI